MRVLLKQRVLLKNVATDRYLDENDEWVSDPDEARDFYNSVMALDYAWDQRLTNTAVVLKFPRPELDVEFEACC